MTITISNDDLHTANEHLAIRVADLVRERDVAIGECLDAQATAQQFKDERDIARRERNLAHAEARVSGEMVAAMSRHMREARLENAGLTDEIVRLVAALTATTDELAVVRKELAETGTLRVLRRRVHRS